MATQKFSRLRACTSALAVLTFVTACGKSNAEPTSKTLPASSAQAAPAATGHAAPHATPGAPRSSAAAGTLKWTMPAGWKEQPPRPARKATYQAPGAAGSAEVTVFYFGAGQGGDVEANIARWVRQFKDLPEDQVRRDQLEVRGFHISTVRISRGEFASGMPGGPAQAQKDWGMNAAVVETPEGPYFFKMTGPAATVDAEAPRFQALLESVQTGG